MTENFSIKQIYHLVELKKSGLSNQEIMRGLEKIDDLMNETSASISASVNLNISNSLSPKASDAASPSLKRKSTVLDDNNSLLTPTSQIKATRISLNNECEDSSPTIPMEKVPLDLNEEVLNNIDNEVKDLLYRDVQDVKDEIQHFMAEFSIKQTTIVRMLENSITQTFLSSWLHKPHVKSFHKVKQLYEWYINFKRHLAASQPSYKAQPPYESPILVRSTPPMSENSEHSLVSEKEAVIDLTSKLFSNGKPKSDSKWVLLWQHFEKLNPGQAKCYHCTRILQYGSMTSNLISHFKRCSPIKYAEYMELKRQIFNPSSDSSKYSFPSSMM